MARQLTKLDVVAPGKLGVNREQRSRILHPNFATKATNFRLSADGVMGVRKGQTDSTGTPITATPNVETLHEYIKADASVETIVAWDGGIGNSIDDPEGNDVSGSLTDANGTWRMQNFNDKCLAFQSGQKLAVYTGTTFATVVEGSGTAPSSGIATCAFGRVWQVDNTDGANLKYSGLLDETDWGGSGAGSIDFSNIWTQGQDRITAIAGYNGTLVVFGIRHIVIISDGTGSELGLNPANAYVADVIQGTGCVDQETIQLIGETELVYLSPEGVQSLSRVIQERSNPTKTVSKYVRTELLEAYRAETAGAIRSTYNSDEGLYLLTFPSDKTYAFDTRWLYQDEQGDLVAPVFEWDITPTALLSKEDGTLLFGGAGEVFTYSGFTDNGTDIALTFETGWLDFGEELANVLKILKRLGFIIFSADDNNVVLKWWTDFNTNANQYTKSFSSASSGAEWNVALWGTSEWGGSAAQKVFRVPARATAEYFKIGFSASTSQSFDVQQFELIAKIGRLA